MLVLGLAWETHELQERATAQRVPSISAAVASGAAFLPLILTFHAGPPSHQGKARDQEGLSAVANKARRSWMLASMHAAKGHGKGTWAAAHLPYTDTLGHTRQGATAWTARRLWRRCGR